ncbi:hypothetical protein FO519_008504, partial [Halicephalobus sp. NKZ332]
MPESSGVVEFRVDSQVFDGYNWTDFEEEIGYIFHDSTSASPLDFLFVRKYCEGNDIVIQTVRLDDVEKTNKERKINDANLMFTRSTELDLLSFQGKKLLTYELKDIRRPQSLYPLKTMKSKEMTNICLKSNLPTPTICNTHSEARKCVCRFTEKEAFKGTDTVSCDKLFDIDDDTKNHEALYSTVIYDMNYQGSAEAFDEMILSDLEYFLRVEPGSLVMLRKFCKNEKLHVQFVQLGNPSRNPIFFSEDLIPNQWNHIEFYKVPKLKNGILARFQVPLPLIPITESNDFLFDATIFTKFYYNVFFSGDPQHYFILLSPLLCFLTIIFFVKRHLDLQEEEFDKLFPRPKKRRTKLISNGVTKPLLSNHYTNELLTLITSSIANPMVTEKCTVTTVDKKSCESVIDRGINENVINQSTLIEFGASFGHALSASDSSTKFIYFITNIDCKNFHEYGDLEDVLNFKNIFETLKDDSISLRIFNIIDEEQLEKAEKHSESDNPSSYTVEDENSASYSESKCFENPAFDSFSKNTFEKVDLEKDFWEKYDGRYNPGQLILDEKTPNSPGETLEKISNEVDLVTDPLDNHKKYFSDDSSSPSTTNSSNQTAESTSTTTEATTTISAADSQDKALLYAIIAICATVIVVALCCGVICLLKMKYRFSSLRVNFYTRNLFRRNEAHSTTAGNEYRIAPDSIQIEFDKWEIQVSDLIINKNEKLGSGAFAAVYKGYLKGKNPLFEKIGNLHFALEMAENSGNEVAIKMLHEHSDEVSREELRKEIEFMKTLGFHPHVLNMIGCV